MAKNSKLLLQVNIHSIVHSIEFIIFSGPYTFTIGDTTKFGIYTGGGTVTELKKPEIVKFVSFF